MAVIDSEYFLNATGITVTGADATSIATLCSAVSSALERKCYPFSLEPKTLTTFAIDAPLGNWFVTPLLPCRSLTAVYLRWGANGDSSTLTSDDLLTNYTDYYLPVDDALNSFSRSGKVYRRGASVWGYELRRPLGKLAPVPDPNRGAIFVSGTFGFATTPDAVREAACRAVTLLYHRRKEGAPYASESWNGRSQSIAGPFSATAAVESPEVVDLLRSAGVLPYHVG